MRPSSGVCFAFVAFVAACHGKAAESSPSQGGALEVYRDGCDAAACGDRPAPKHRCVGGYELTVCTRARGACGWQVDCADDPPPGYDPAVAVATCGAADAGATSIECGPLPAYDERDCVYGFVGEPQCERYGRSPCAWSRRCRPRPCEQTGTCNTLDRTRLGAPCDAFTTCPEGATCASISVGIGDQVPPRCIAGSPCDALTCAAGRTCYVASSYPAQVGCSPSSSP